LAVLTGKKEPEFQKGRGEDNEELVGSSGDFAKVERSFTFQKNHGCQDCVRESPGKRRDDQQI